MIKTIIVFLLSASFACAQRDKTTIYIAGYIVLTAGDTVHGKVAMLSPDESCEHVDFKTDSINSEQKYNAHKVKFYKRGVDMFYARPVYGPNKLGKKVRFVKRIGTGKINTYQYNFKVQASTANSTNSSLSIGSGKAEYFTEYYLEKEDVFKGITQLNYKGDLWGFFKGDKEMVTKVRKTHYDYESIPKIIIEYNQTH